MKNRSDVLYSSELNAFISEIVLVVKYFLAGENHIRRSRSRINISNDQGGKKKPQLFNIADTS